MNFQKQNPNTHHLNVNRTNPNSTYVKVELKFKGYKKYHICAYIDTGASLCVAHPEIIPEEYWEQSDNEITVRVASDEYVKMNKVAKNMEINMCGNKFIFPKIYHQSTGIDLIIGNNFLKLNSPFVQTNDYISIVHHLTNELIICPIMKNAYKVAQHNFLD